MVLEIVYYGHPVLRQRGKKITLPSPEVEQLAKDMVETMHDAAGVGLAAQQIGQALQICVIDVRGVEDRPSTLEIQGQPVDVDAHMPMVLINLEWKATAPPVPGPEGCLSFPEIYGDVARPAAIEVSALGVDGSKLHFTCSGLLARAIQHEYDHLQGVLFIDRMNAEEKEKLKKKVDRLHASVKRELAAQKKLETLKPKN